MAAPRLALPFDFMQTKRVEKSRAAFNEQQQTLKWETDKKSSLEKLNETAQSKFDCALFLQTSKHKLSAYFPAPPRWPFKAQLSFMANLWAA